MLRVMARLGKILRCYKKGGLIIRPTGRSAIVAPPLIIQASEIDEIGRRLERALELTLHFPGENAT